MNQSERTRRSRTASELPRKAWIDVGKGTAMVLVVLLHSSAWIETQFNEGDSTFWFLFSEIFGPVRMPLFFFISGYLASPALRRPLGASKARTLGFLYIYALWTILFVARLWLPVPGSGSDAPSVVHAALAVLLPTSFWYLWALAVFFIVSWVALRLLGGRALWLIIPLTVLALAGVAIDAAEAPALTAPMDTLKFGELAQNFVWFYAGLYLKEQWERALERATVRATLLMASVYAAGFAAIWTLDLLSPARPLLAALGLVLSAYALAVLPLDGVVGRVLAQIGKSTLPVYIFHIFLISVLSAAVKIMGFDDIIAANLQLWSVVLPPVMTALLVSLCMWVGGLVLRSPLRWTLSPEWLKKSGAKTQL